MENHHFNILFTAMGALALYLVFRRTRTPKLLNSAPKGFGRDEKAASHVPSTEAQIVKLVELAREIEARVQNKALLLQHMLDDADRRVSELRALTGEKPVARNAEEENPIYEQVRTLAARDKSDREIGEILCRSESEVRLLKRLEEHSRNLRKQA